jgi:hypothetical protein
MATTISFTVSGLKETIMNKIATSLGKTMNEYAEGVVTDELEGRVRSYYKGKFNKLTSVEMINLFGDIE